MCHGHSALTIRSTPNADTGCDPASRLDARAAHDDAVLLVQEVSPAARRLPGKRARLGRICQLRAVHQFQLLLAQCPGNAGYRGRCAGDYRRAGCPARHTARPAVLGSGCRSHPRHRSVLRYADRIGAGLEEHAHGSGERGSLRISGAFSGPNRCLGCPTRQ